MRLSSGTRAVSSTVAPSQLCRGGLPFSCGEMRMARSFTKSVRFSSTLAERRLKARSHFLKGIQASLRDPEAVRVKVHSTENSEAPPESNTLAPITSWFSENISGWRRTVVAAGRRPALLERASLRRSYHTNQAAPPATSWAMRAAGLERRAESPPVCGFDFRLRPPAWESRRSAGSLS